MKEISLYSFFRAELGGLFHKNDRLCIVAIPHGLGKVSKFAKTVSTFGKREELLSAGVLTGLRRKNNAGYSIYFSVCPLLPDATSRKAANACSARAIWADFDALTPAMEAFLRGEGWGDIPAPNLAVSTSPARWQFFWRLPDGENRSVTEICTEVKRIATVTGADKTVADPARIMRLPGFQNRKPGRGGWNCRAYLVERNAENIPYSCEENPESQQKYCPLFSSKSWTREQWLSVGRALFRHHGERGVLAWLAMSRLDTQKWPGKEKALSALISAPWNPWGCDKLGCRREECGAACRNALDYLRLTRLPTN
ncbi:MAG: DNA-primase RepB domain-containing protein [bacterium]|nr:DNA-primase RepB domain-containing protein [bacterium]